MLSGPWSRLRDPQALNLHAPIRHVSPKYRHHSPPPFALASKRYAGEQSRLYCLFRGCDALPLSYRDVRTPRDGIEPSTLTVSEVTVLFTTGLRCAAAEAALRSSSKRRRAADWIARLRPASRPIKIKALGNWRFRIARLPQRKPFATSEGPDPASHPRFGRRFHGTCGKPAGLEPACFQVEVAEIFTTSISWPAGAGRLFPGERRGGRSRWGTK